MKVCDAVIHDELRRRNRDATRLAVLAEGVECNSDVLSVALRNDRQHYWSAATRMRLHLMIRLS